MLPGHQQTLFKVLEEYKIKYVFYKYPLGISYFEYFQWSDILCQNGRRDYSKDNIILSVKDLVEL